ncbi:MAG: Mrp/NBP35 family ATP-binding protein [Phascolarctobacterium sp.]|nr:Mrp/NBP35 family ATP-binding protein [Phascolarctobacterium sp.]
MSSVKKVIGIVSGKGGVGKSLVTSLMAATMKRRGHRTAILDADVTGPSIPKAFGLSGQKTGGNEIGIMPLTSANGIEIISANMFLPNESDPVVWRGPMIANMVKQFWTDVVWTDIDFMFVDMPPGTGDVPLTVFQSLPVDGIIIVTSPQELVSMIVAKAVKMAQMMNIPILGLVENYSYFHCPDNGKDYKIFGESHLEETAAAYGLKVLAQLPIDPAIAKACDSGKAEEISLPEIDKCCEYLEGAWK